jgi:hypothetical protein
MINKIDKVQNPWRVKKDIVVLDIETDWLYDWSEQGKRDSNFRCGVVFSYNDKKYHKFKVAKKLVKFLKKYKAIVSYNGEGFDFLVLEQHGLKIKKYKNRWKPLRIKSLDIMHTIQERRPKKHHNKKYPSLEEMMLQHYGVNKIEYNPKDLKEVMKHCRKDVEYTKKLYEEKSWDVPVIERSSKKRIWDNYYDDDDSGVVWDGENWTYVADFARPVGSGGVIKFAPGTPKIISAKSKKEVAKNVCPNCGKRLDASEYEHYGYGAGHGFISEGRSICPICGKGCYDWEDDDTLGFRHSWRGSCCFCGKDIDKWYINQHNRKNRKQE